MKNDMVQAVDKILAKAIDSGIDATEIVMKKFLILIIEMTVTNI